VHGQSFLNGHPTAAGTAIYNYSNDQSARTIWYHDHAYSLTRTNVFAGLASAYLITDNDLSGEAGLISSGTIPGNGLTALTGQLGIPLIVQDKTFWDGPSGHDPGYGAVPPAGAAVADLWYPHVYEGDLDTNLPDMTLPTTATSHARWALTDAAALPPVSTVPEYFSDTILVNGAPYPTFTVPPRRFRFRFVNASQARFYNLQLYVADGTPDGITLVDIGEVDPNGNPILAPANRPGPAFIQIGNEAGFLPEPAVFSIDNGVTNLNSNRVMGYKLNSTALASRNRADQGVRVLVGGELIRAGAEPGDATIGNADRFNLLMAPAERPDVIIDFRGFTGKTLILYNDSPAPFPGGDIRNDYFVVNPSASGLPANYNDLTAIGGAPPTTAGFGPDTRVLMQFVVSGTEISEPTFADTVTALRNPSTGLPFVFANTQPADITPTVTKIKSLLEDNDQFGGRLRQLISDETVTAITLLDTPTDLATQNEVQRWEVYNMTADTHPMHFHLVNVKVRSRQQWAFNPDGSPVIPLQPLAGSPVLPPDPNEMGWKETVRMNPGEITTVDMQFTLPAGTPPPNSPGLCRCST
jgi:spore coat protein A